MRMEGSRVGEGLDSGPYRKGHSCSFLSPHFPFAGMKVDLSPFQQRALHPTQSSRPFIPGEPTEGAHLNHCTLSCMSVWVKMRTQ